MFRYSVDANLIDKIERAFLYFYIPEAWKKDTIRRRSMLDIKLLRENPKEIKKKLKTKLKDIDLDPILSLDEDIRLLQLEVEELKSQQNSASKLIGEKKRNKEDASSILEEMGQISSKIHSLDKTLSEKTNERQELLFALPNIPNEDVPVSLNPQENVCIKEHGERKTFSFPFKNHLELNEKLKLFDFERGAKISGRGFPIYTDRGAKLEWALINYMLDIHRKEGYTHIMPPILLRKEMMIGSAHLIPKFEDQLFKINDKDFHLYLLPTAEAALNALHQDEIIEEERLPLSYTAYTPCFRREAGAAGSNERGLIRTHQFNKVELFSICKPEDSDKIFEKMLKSAESVVKGLDLHYKNMLLVSGDTSFAAAKTIDLEVFLPGQDRYYEVSSISNCTDFQARRAKIRYRNKGEKPLLVHTLNASGVATSRLMVALLENNQQEDGSVILPKALYPYLDEEMLHLK